MQDQAAGNRRSRFRSDHLSLSLLLAISPQQLAIDLGDFLQVVSQLVVVFNPGANLGQLILADDTASGAASPQGDRQVPQGAVSLAPRTFAGWVAAGHVAFHQGATQDFRHRRQLRRQALPPLSQGQLGKSR
jgi:hypothetical protein